MYVIEDAQEGASQLRSLRHNGILVLQPPPARGLKIVVRGKETVLDALQEEMAIAWVKKLDTPYVKDPVFCKNFMMDFSKALGVKPPLSPEEIDFSEVISRVEAEKAAKASMSPQERRADLLRRKAEREALREKYGHAEVDGVRMELANYQTEPSGIFMGRGDHPLRGRWKRGALHSDITLNLSRDAPVPEGDWREVVWEPECMWIAKWTDDLTGKTKYIWLHDSTPIKQEREAAKYDKAVRLRSRLEEIREHILSGILSDDQRRRMVAAACYLIDRLSVRVGDEKDPDEADTVGATTLRVEHLTLKNDSTIVFDFLGKDSVPWHKELVMPPEIFAVFRDLYNKACERVSSFQARKGRKTSADPKKVAQIFPGITSNHVNRFLGEVDPDLTAKVFRTIHATTTMEHQLSLQKVQQNDPEFIKKEAFRRANLEVARVMNHTKQAPKGWDKTARRFESRIKTAESRVKSLEVLLEKRQNQVKQLKDQLESKRLKLEAALEKQRELVEECAGKVKYWREICKSGSSDVSTSGATNAVDPKDCESRLRRAQASYKRAKDRLEARRTQLSKLRETSAKRLSKAESALTKLRERIKKARAQKRALELDYAFSRASRTMNLTTSLKSYIHPRVVYDWCQSVDYDWRKVYSKTLQRKFAWVCDSHSIE